MLLNSITVYLNGIIRTLSSELVESYRNWTTGRDDPWAFDVVWIVFRVIR